MTIPSFFYSKSIGRKGLQLLLLAHIHVPGIVGDFEPCTHPTLITSRTSGRSLQHLSCFLVCKLKVFPGIKNKLKILENQLYHKLTLSMGWG